MFTSMWYLCIKLIQYNEYSTSIVVTDGLVLKHQCIRSHNAEYAPFVFLAVYGLDNHTEFNFQYQLTH